MPAIAVLSSPLLSQHRYLHNYLLGVCTYPLLRSRPLKVPLLQRVTFEERESNQSALAPPLGASPRLGMPAVRHCSVGPPRSAIHGRVAATPASMPGCPLRNTCLRPSWFDGAHKIKSQIKNRATAPPERAVAFPCGSRQASSCKGQVCQRLPSIGSISANSASSRPLPPPISSSSTILRSQSACSPSPSSRASRAPSSWIRVSGLISSSVGS